MARQMVTISHPEIEGTAVVPATALPHMDPRWEVVDASEAASAPTQHEHDGPGHQPEADPETPADVAGSTTENQE